MPVPTRQGQARFPGKKLRDAIYWYTPIHGGSLKTTQQPLFDSGNGIATDYLAVDSGPVSGTSFTLIATVDGSKFGGGNPGVWRGGAASNGGDFFIFNGSRFPWIRANGGNVLLPSSGDTLPSRVVTLGVKISAGNYEVWWDGRLRHSSSDSTVFSGAESITNIGWQNDVAEKIGGIIFCAFLRGVNHDLKTITNNPWSLFNNSTNRYSIQSDAAQNGSSSTRLTVKASSVSTKISTSQTTPDILIRSSGESTKIAESTTSPELLVRSSESSEKIAVGLNSSEIILRSSSTTEQIAPGVQTGSASGRLFTRASGTATKISDSGGASEITLRSSTGSTKQAFAESVAKLLLRVSPGVQAGSGSVNYTNANDTCLASGIAYGNWGRLNVSSSNWESIGNQTDNWTRL